MKEMEGRLHAAETRAEEAQEKVSGGVVWEVLAHQILQCRMGRDLDFSILFSIVITFLYAFFVLNIINQEE